MSVYTLALATLAVYRISYLIALENGPFFIMAKIREIIGNRLGWDSWLALGITCPLCISFWLTLLVAWLLGGGWLEWLGMAGAVLTIHLLAHPR